MIKKFLSLFKKKEIGPVTRLLSDPEKWTQRAIARNKGGDVISPTLSDAHSFCILGAIKMCYGDDDYKARIKFRNIVGEVSLIDWNDNSKRTHKQVLRACKKAGI